MRNLSKKWTGYVCIGSVRLDTDLPESLRASEQGRVGQLREELKTALETQRHRLEYENIAQKIVVYPSREEMEGCVFLQRPTVRCLLVQDGSIAR